jgi:hypothetical protein
LTGSGAFTEILGGETERSLFYEYREWLLEDLGRIKGPWLL